jgi:hypothetical protein
LHNVSRFRLERFGHVSQGAPEAAGGVKLDGIGVAWGAHRDEAYAKKTACRVTTHYAAGLFAFRWNSCWPPHLVMGEGLVLHRAFFMILTYERFGCSD